MSYRLDIPFADAAQQVELNESLRLIGLHDAGALLSGTFFAFWIQKFLSHT